MRLGQRLTQLEAKVIPVKPTRFFTGYEATGRYYEARQTVNYRFGINGEAEPGPYLTRADIAELERTGQPCSVITIAYVDNWRDGKQ